MARLSLFMGGISGFLAIALSAFVTHGLRNLLSSHDLESVTMALHYQFLHATLLAIIGLMLRLTPVSPPKILGLAIAFFLFGILLFCGSIYTALLAGYPSALHLAPAGGIGFMLGWLTLAIMALSASPRC